MINKNLTISEALQALNSKKELTTVNEAKEEERRFIKISHDNEVYEETENLNEDVNSSMPVTILPEDEIINFVMSIEPARRGAPLKTFKLGYIAESKAVASKFRGGRGSVNKETGEALPNVRIFKCTEYSRLETAVNPNTTRAGLYADKVLGTERHTGEKTGFRYTEDEKAFRIGEYADGSKALQACINANSRQLVKYFISINGGDLEEVDRETVALYLTPAEAAKLNAPKVYKPAGQDSKGNDVYDKPINRFKLTGIYMIGSLGNSIF